MCIYFIAALSFLFTAKYLCTKIASFDYKRLGSRSKDVLLWLRRGKDVFGGTFVVVAFVAICWILGWNNKAFTALGCVLELAGLAQAIISLFDVREYFNHPRLADICKKWIKERPRLKRSSGAVSAQGSVSSGMNVSCSAVMILRSVDMNRPVDENIKILAENFNELSEKNLLEHNSFDGEIKRLKSDMRNEADKIKVGHTKELEHLHLGDFTPTLVGFAWIAAGTIMSAIGSLLP